MIKVLIVDDSETAQQFLMHIFSLDPDIEVVGLAKDGSEVLALVRDKHPDVITMDIHMQKMDGFEATRIIMENHPTPIVIVSASTSTTEVESTFQALDAGALAFVLRPPGLLHPSHQSSVRELISTVKLMSEIKVVRRISNLSKSGLAMLLNTPITEVEKRIKLIVIGASTGGPPVLHKIMSSLPSDFPVPVLIVQHIAEGFINGFVEWLSKASGFPVHVAEHGQKVLPGNGYIAPDKFQMGISKDMHIILSKAPPLNGICPSADYLFLSAAESFGARSLGVLLTGMGKDGASGLKTLKDCGAVTIAQDKSSSIVHGMPGEAIRLDAASFILTPDDISAALINFTNNQ